MGVHSGIDFTPAGCTLMLLWVIAQLEFCNSDSQTVQKVVLRLGGNLGVSRKLIIKKKKITK